MRYLYFLSVLCLFSCGQEKETDNKMIATDHLFAQRSYPYGKIDLEAYQTAVKTRKNYMDLSRGPFDNTWTSLGPVNICGRVTDLEITRNEAAILYTGTASGGLFRSEDRGENWTAVFDDEMSLAIGDLAVSTLNPNRIYVGTGEANAGGGSLGYDGIGVFVSEDAGDSWTHKGLDKAGSIGRIVIDPKDDDRAYVAAMGSLFEKNDERGIYRTTDAGDNWEQVLFVSDSTGGIDLAIHPTDGNIIYAALWERIRTVTRRDFGGITTGIYKSMDAGDSWQELTVGLPYLAADKGRIGLAISESHPDIIYAFYANAIGHLNGIYKTENGGDNWALVESDLVTVSFNWWFGKIFVHPTNPDDVYLTNLVMYRSKDGAKSWEWVFHEAHVDHHAMAIHPDKPELVFNGNDGGVNMGLLPEYEASIFKPGMNSLQFYTCEIDPNNPAIIYGGAQDNGILKMSEADGNWEKIFGGDGQRVLVDPRDSERIYFSIQYGSLRTSRDGGDSIEFAHTGLEGKFNFNAPLAIDPNNPAVLYTGAQSLQRTTDRGEQWVPISPTLTKQEFPQGANRFGTITAIEVSAKDSRIVYVGTDDGNVWVTKDWGETYVSINEGLPNRWITALTHDPHLLSGVYVSVSGFRYGESESQIFYSDNYGESWRSIATSMPDIPVNDILADHKIEDLIFAATDIGVFVSHDNGKQWKVLGTNMPVVAVTDLDIHSESRTLIAATFGKGMYRYDLPLNVSVGNQEHSSLLNIYPNPTSGRVHFKSDQKILSVEVYNISGKLLLREDAISILDLSELPIGCYLTKIRMGDHVVIKKIILQE